MQLLITAVDSSRHFEERIIDERANLIFDERLFHLLQNIMYNRFDIRRLAVEGVADLQHFQEDCQRDEDMRKVSLNNLIALASLEEVLNDLTAKIDFFFFLCFAVSI